MGPRGVTTGDDILEVGLDLRGVAHEKGCYHRGAKHLWAGLAPQWDNLRARLFFHNVTNLRQQRFREAEYRA